MKVYIFCMFLVCVCAIDKSYCYFGLFGRSDKCKSFYNYSESDIVAVILARGGSKGIYLKNLAKIGSETLLSRSIKTILKSKIFSDIWVSTDHSRISEEALKHNAKVHIRPSHLAGDRTTSISSLQEFLNCHPEVFNIALLQCTSVFLKEKYLQDAVQLFRASRVDCVFSVARSFKLRWKYNHTTGLLSPINFNAKKRPRRQDWDGELVETGMIYVATSWLLKNGLFQNDRCGFVEIDSNDVLEIDSPEDLKLANVLLELR